MLYCKFQDFIDEIPQFGFLDHMVLKHNKLGLSRVHTKIIYPYLNAA